jgi:hypothetical protein
MAAPDAFGRIRILLVAQRASGAPDPSAWALRAALPAREGYGYPYLLHAPDTEGVSGELWAVPPAHRKKYWLGVAEELRGQEVYAELTVREYAFAQQGIGGPEAAQARGYALDVAWIEPAAEAERRWALQGARI